MYALICPLVLAFAMKVLGQVNIQCVQFSSIHLSKQSLRKPQETNTKRIHRRQRSPMEQNCSFSDGICPAQLTFIIAEQPSVMVIASGNRPLIRLGYYGSACCQSRLCVLHLCQDENIVQKQHGVAWRPPWALPDSSGDGGSCVFSRHHDTAASQRRCFLAILKSGKSSQIPGKELTAFSIFSYTNGRNQFLLESSHHIVLWVWGDNVCESALKIGNLFMEVGWLYCYCQSIKFSTYCQSLEEESLKPFLLF